MYLNLQTERLTLRPLVESDASFVLRLVNSEGWLRFIGDRNVGNKDGAILYIQKVLGNPNVTYLVFELKETKEPLGVVTLIDRAEFDYPDIGFALLPEHAKKGYTLEASKAYLVSIMETGQFKNILAITKPENNNAIRLLVKLGMKYARDFVKDEETLCLFQQFQGNSES